MLSDSDLSSKDQNLESVLINNERTAIKTTVQINRWIILCLAIPSTICDLYFSENNNLCLYNTSKDLQLNLETYLIVNVAYGIIVSVISVITACATIPEDLYSLEFSRIIKINKVFVISWTIIGAFLFWKYSDTSACNVSIHTYLFISIIVRVAFCGWLFAESSCFVPHDSIHTNPRIPLSHESAIV